MNMIWKQPIQTNLNSIFGDNFLAKHLYIELLLRASNTDKEKEFAGTLHFLKRGQCVCGEEELATEYQVHRQTIRGALGRLQKVYNKINIKPTNKGTIVTILNYDDVVSFQQQNVQQDDNRTTSNVQQKDTNKNVENVEIEKIEDKKEIVKEKLTSKNSKTACTEEEIKNIAKKLQVSVGSVERTHNIILNKIATGEFKNKTVYLSLENWVLMGIERGNIQRINPINMLGANYKLQNKVI